MAFLPGRIRAALVLNVALPVRRSGTALRRDLGLYLPVLDRERVRGRGRPGDRRAAGPSGRPRGRCDDLLQPWVSNASDDVISIRADMVDGFRLVA
jgi:hypothetical protein